jgi:hypothetical protein
MTRWVSATLVLLLMLSAGCDEAGGVNGSDSRPPGAMSYSGYDDLGRRVVTGWIVFDIPNIQDGPPIPLEFNGTWELRALVDPGRVGPQNGSGVLAGQITDSGVVVDLQPGQLDNNVALTGTLTAGGPAPMRYEGVWRWVTLTGVRASGTFSASQ